MQSDLALERLSLQLQAFDLVAEAQDGEEVLFLRQLLLRFDLALQVFYESAQVFQCILGEILGRRRVLLDTIQVLDCLESMLTLLVNNSIEPLVLLRHLLDDLLFDTLLLHDGALHGRALFEGSLRLVEQLLKVTDLQLGGLLEGHTAPAAAMIIEVTIVAECLVVDLAVRGQIVLVLAHSNLGLRGGRRHGLGWIAC